VTAEQNEPAIPLALALSFVQTGIGDQLTQARAELVAEMVEQWRRTGVAPTWRHELGTLSLSVPKPAVQVVNEEEFFDWVLSNHEGEIEVITRVRPAFQAAVLADLVPIADEEEDEETGQKVRVLRVLSKRTGEQVDTPGIAAVPGGEPNSISVRLTPDAKATAAARAAGWLGRLELTQGDGGEEGR
jgi:hypothetical protein